ncbi:hypothetical protein SASPL_110339 [Salvia splendens]|uniref:Protein brassinosteroid insensitive 1 n=1 Tax=Salvia splendens TaxID=180675 RepID=A0A8X8YAB5_SALSN|nr:hypothetical protein SASPL_110339 [Salvia splendens]
MIIHGVFLLLLSLGSNISREVNWGWNASSDPCTTIGKASRATATGPPSRKSSSTSSTSLGPSTLPPSARPPRLSGSLPVSLSRLKNLKRFDVSDNGISGGIPDFTRISGLLTFLAQNNRLNGSIPNFSFENLEEFNVSNNDLSGAIPAGGGGLSVSRFLGNPLCGAPLPNACPPLPPPPPPPRNEGDFSKKDYFIYSGYGMIGVIVVLLIAFKLMKKKVRREKKDAAAKGFGFWRDSGHDKISGSSSDSKAGGGNRSEFSITLESGKNSSSLTVLSSPLMNGLKFEDLLRSPAEMISRGRHGSMYKVTVEEGLNLAAGEALGVSFSRKWQPLQPPSWTCKRWEVRWGSKLNLAAKIAEALAYMHQGLKGDGIAHGNLKSSNIFVSKEMEPLISESVSSLGIVLLELLTGKVVQNNGMELARWVNSAIREVFDKAVVVEGASELRMVMLLQLALKCIDGSGLLLPKLLVSLPL